MGLRGPRSLVRQAFRGWNGKRWDSVDSSSDEPAEHLACEDAREKAERWFYEGLIAGQMQHVAELFTPDVVMHCATGTLRGLAALQAAVLELHALGGLHGGVTITGEGAQLVAIFAVRGRHVRTLWGSEPTGRLVEVHGIVTIRTRGARLAELWTTCASRHPEEASCDPQPPAETAWARRWRLTLREALVADLAMRGHCDKQIASELKLATASVSKYLRSVMRKAKISSRTALAEHAGVVRLG